MCKCVNFARVCKCVNFVMDCVKIDMLNGVGKNMKMARVRKYEDVLSQQQVNGYNMWVCGAYLKKIGLRSSHESFGPNLYMTR